ncbi:DUF6612 family protein [Thermoactinomyces sp. FSL K6-2592]|uniref:DUF6612 family protein n=1 Tax=Thermoactinomyces sp. FSL K6-2592 TaxID=2975347 RepID=UPI0030FD1E3F
MKSFKNVIRLFSFVFLLIFTSACSINFNADSANQQNAQQPPAEQLSAQDVLKKSLEEMQKLKGYKWQVTANQNIKASEPGIGATTTINAGIDYLDEMNFRSDMQISTEFSQDQSRENLSWEIIAKDNTVYIRDGVNNKWAKAKMTPEMVEHFIGLDQEYSNPDFILKQVITDANAVNMTEQNDSYVVELTLNDPNKIKPYMEYALRNWQKDADVKHDQIQFNSFKLTLHISKADHKLNKVEQNVQVHVPLNIDPNASIDFDQKMNFDFRGEVTSITVPSDAQSAPEVDLNSSDSRTYKPGSIFKGIEGGIDPNFGSDSSNSSGSDKEPFVDPSFGSY